MWRHDNKLLRLMRIICAGVAMCLAGRAQAQFNNVILFDCSKSMICPDGDYAHPDPTKRWEPAKAELKKWLLSYQDNDMVTVVLFYNGPVHTVSCKKKDLDWDAVEGIMDREVKKGGKTGICAAWDAAERFLNAPLPTYLYIITDGEEEMSTKEALAERITSFCAKHPNARGVFFGLDKAAFPAQIEAALESAPCFSKNLGNIKAFGCFDPMAATVVTDSMRAGGVDRATPLRFPRKDRLSMTAVADDPYFTVAVADDAVAGGLATLLVGLKPGFKLDALKARLLNDGVLDGDDAYTLEATLRSDEIIFSDSIVAVRVVLRPLSEVRLCNDVTQIELGTARWHGRWLLAGRQPDALTCTLHPQFNAEARHRGASLDCVVSNLPDSCRLYVNGVAAPDGRFRIKAGDGDPSLAFCFAAPLPDMDIDAALTVERAAGVEQLVSSCPTTDPRQFSVPIYGGVAEQWNPAKTAAAWLAAAAALLLLVRVFYNLFLRRTMSGNLRLVDDKGNTLRRLGQGIDGCHRVVLAATGRGDYYRRGLLQVLLTSKTLHADIAGFDRPLVLTGRGNGTLFVAPNKAYQLDGRNLAVRATLRPSTRIFQLKNLNTQIQANFKR